MTKHHDDVEEQTTAVETADSLKAWLASPAQGYTHAEDSEAASGPENTPDEDVPGDDTEEDAQEGHQEPQEKPGGHQREDDTPAAPEAASGPERRPQRRCDALRQAHLTCLELGQVRRGDDTCTRDARPAAQQPRARSNEDSNEENHAPARTPPRARPTQRRSAQGRDYPPPLTPRPQSVLVANIGSEFWKLFQEQGDARHSAGWCVASVVGKGWRHRSSPVKGTGGCRSGCRRKRSPRVMVAGGPCGPDSP